MTDAHHEEEPHVPSSDPWVIEYVSNDTCHDSDRGAGENPCEESKDKESGPCRCQRASQRAQDEHGKGAQDRHPSPKLLAQGSPKDRSWPSTVSARHRSREHPDKYLPMTYPTR